ncbi:hypothetical protein BN1708_020097, partial [Verticillium longisporum]
PHVRRRQGWRRGAWFHQLHPARRSPCSIWR